MSRRTKRAERELGWVRRLSGYVLRHRANLVIAFAGALVGSLAQVIVPLVERQVVNDVVGHSTATIAPLIGALLGLGVITFVGSYFRRYRGGRVALDVQYDLRNAMHHHLQELDPANLDQMPTGQLVARANSDSTLVQGLLSFLPIMSGNILMLVLSLGVMLYLSPLLAVVSVLVAPSLAFLSYRMRWRVFPATWDAQQREGEVAQIVDEDVNGVRIVKAFAQESRELERMLGASKTLYGSQMRAVRLQSLYQPLLEAVPMLGQIGVLALGGYLAITRSISLGTFLAFSAYLAQMASPARMLAGVLTIGQQARAGADRIFQLLDTKPAIADPPDAIELGEVEGHVVFDDVHFSYGDKPVLDGFSLEIAPGETVALVGSSGTGKSSTALLLARFYDVSAGSISIDGHDVRQLSLASLRSNVGIAFEESFLFSESVRENIAYGRPESSDAEIEKAARAAEAHGFISELPRGYETVVGERGLTLSGGQRQRVALARTILAAPQILVLDDATSAIDATIEARIHVALRELFKGRSTLVIAHRRSTLHLADRIAILEDGRIAEAGTHEELMEKSARYRRLLGGLEETELEAARGRVEALAALSAATAPVLPQASAAKPAFQSVGAASMGPGLMGGGGSWRKNLAPTPELLARVAALKPVSDFPEVDLLRETRRDRHFGLKKLLREFRRPLLIGLVLVVIDALASLAGPVLVKTGIDSGVASGSKLAVFVASGIYLGVAVVDLFDEVGATFVTGRTAQRIMLSLRIRIWAQLQRLSLDYYEREMAGRIMTRMTTDVDQFESLIENGLLSALVSMVTFVGVGVALIVLNWRLALVTLSVVVPLAAATTVFRRKAARTYDRARDAIAVVNADFQESISGVREAQAYVHEEATEERFRALGRRYLEARVAAQRLVARYFPFVAFLADVAAALVLGVGAGLVRDGELTTGALIAFVLYIDLFFSPIQQLSQVFDSWQQTRISVERIAELMALDPLTPEAEDATDPVIEGRLRLSGVRFSYPLAPPRPGAGLRVGPADSRSAVTADAMTLRPPEALKGVELELSPGETLALVGETGAGKSTVMKLLARFYDPDEGAVTVGGRDLRGFSLEQYRQRLGYVPQESFLFTGTIADNISYGRPDATRDEVEQAARAVGADDVVASLPGGYDHVISERGHSLSAGQRQLVALARAELVDPAILLLDEATSNLDLVTEAKVQRAMEVLAEGRTTLVIAHRLQTARRADRIAVLAEGRVEEVGTHEALLETGGRYAAMWRSFEMVTEKSA